MIEAVIFDLYGTLIRLDRDTRPYLRLAHLVSPERPRAIVRRSLLEETRGIADFAARLGASTPAADLDLLDADLRADVQSSRAFAEAPDVLAALRDRGLKLGLISNLASPYKEPFHRHGLDAYFDAALFSCDIGLCKPEPEIYLRMARGWGAEPARIVMVGDGRRPDCEGPIGAGMQARLLRRDGKGDGPGEIASLEDLLGEIRP